MNRPLSTLRVLSRRVFCITVKREAVVTSDHTGRLTCTACGEQVPPIIVKSARASS